MRVIRGQDFKASPWKNGGGTTYEIARSDASEIFGWRLSVAEVKSSGPFSLFPQHSRILVVVEGNGMHLIGSTKTIDAAPTVPVHFSGQEKIDGQLVDGACRDFNLIFDPLRFEANVQIATRKNFDTHCTGFYTLEGQVNCDGQIAQRGDFVFIGEHDAPIDTGMDFRCLAVTIKPF